MGPFFRRLAQDLRERGATVYKINFNGGDWLFFPQAQKNYRGPLAEWPAFFRQAVLDWHIDAVFLYGDCRPVHAGIIPICNELGIPFHTFEEGYVRPDHVTLEKGRVNGYSSLPRDPGFYRRLHIAEPEPFPPLGSTFRTQAAWATAYHVAASLFFPLFPRGAALYHRGLGVRREAPPQVRSYVRKAYYKIRQWRVQERLVARHGGAFYLVPLQVRGDSQISHHSDYGANGVQRFISEVITSFARHAPSDTLLVFKHHPYDRGYSNHARHIRRVAKANGVRQRVLYIHDQHLPTLLNHARGVVVINSTTGLQALHHGVPVKPCGRAIYDLPGLTWQKSLDSFWRGVETFSIDTELLEKFSAYVKMTTQICGSFYKRHRISPMRCGLLWNMPYSLRLEARGRDEQDGRILLFAEKRR